MAEEEDPRAPNKRAEIIEQLVADIRELSGTKAIHAVAHAIGGATALISIALSGFVAGVATSAIWGAAVAAAAAYVAKNFNKSILRRSKAVLEKMKSSTFNVVTDSYALRLRKEWLLSVIMLTVCFAIALLKKEYTQAIVLASALLMSGLYAWLTSLRAEKGWFARTSHH